MASFDETLKFVIKSPRVTMVSGLELPVLNDMVMKHGIT